MGNGCHGQSTSPHQWGDDPSKWKGVIPELPPFQQPPLTGKPGDTQISLDYARKCGGDMAERLQKAITAKMNWILHPTNQIAPTGAYALGNTYKIFQNAQTYIGELNKLANHDPNARQGNRSSGGDDPVEGGEDPAELAAFVKALVKMERVTLADESIPQDPESNGEPVPLFGDDGKELHPEE